MANRKKIRVLVVDDSLVFSEAIAIGIEKDPGIEVVAVASNAFEARDRIIEFRPDVMTLDIEMPKMNGIEFLRQLMPQYPIPVVVVSAINGAVFEALKYGAVEFVTKPGIGSRGGIQGLVEELIPKIKIAANANIKREKDLMGTQQHIDTTAGTGSRSVIAVGSSTGGTEAVLSILKTFTVDMPCTLIVQHMPPVFTRLYAERLNSICSIEVREAKDGDRLYPGLALVAPGGLHIQVKRDPRGPYIRCIKGEKVSGHCPSADVLFNSVADCYGKKAIGVILTGMGKDGAKGLLNMRKKGAKTIGQDETTCVVYGMPRAAYEIGAVDRQAELKDIPRLIQRSLNMIHNAACRH